jgi:heterotetrameric sarcosine oxidase delta subunit
MLLIPCPFCGPRAEIEFRCGGEAHISRPRDPAALSDEAWADYLFMRKNPKGIHHERWWHVHGCRRWFNVTRHTVFDRILAVYPIGATPPISDAEAGQ